MKNSHLQQKARNLSPEERGKFLFGLYEKGFSYKVLAYIFDSTVPIIVDYFRNIDVKRCTHCKKLKSRTKFHNCKNNTDKLISHCKVCAHLKRKKHYDEFQKNNDGIQFLNRQWKAENRDLINERRREQNKTPEKKAKNAKYMRERAKKDPIFRLRLRFSNLISYHLSNGPTRLRKRERHWEDIVGYTLEDLCKHLEAQFDENMSWENYGSYWHVDHIVPASSFKIEKIGDEEFCKCWKLTNLQPLYGPDNIMKSNNIGSEWNNV